jgi:predicted phosphodiesterase
VLSGAGEQSPEDLFSSSADPVLISSSGKWIERVQSSAMEEHESLEAGGTQDWGKQVPEEELKRRLEALRGLLNNYNLFGLALGSWRDDQQLRAFTNYAAIDSREYGLFLIPRGWDPSQSTELLDPFPAIALAAQASSDWPGIVFWSRSETAIFSSLAEAKALYQELGQALSSSEQIEQILKKRQRHARSPAILQLSDLHFGSEWSFENEPYVSTHLHSIADSVDRVVITGDLFDEPRREEARAFHNFRTTLERERGEQAIVIPGNHDQKWRGNVGADLHELAKVEWSSVFVDEKTECVFFCFDSSRDADLARGKVTTEQRLRVATEFDKLALSRPEIKAYLRVALVHHHPFSFETAKETLVSRLLEKIGITDEYFLRMEDAESFLNWCANRGVGLILHGHKHVPRYRKEMISRNDGSDQEITTVGCGTSLGAEGKPLSYNIVEWNSKSRRWSVSYCMDPADGSGFVHQYLSVQGAD